jgi:hypothetical protein
VISVGRIPSQCATCRQTGTLEVTQALREGQVTWAERFSCECGHGFEASGTGLPSPVLREALLRQAGHTEVWLDDAAARPVVARLLRRVLSMSSGEARRRLATLPAVAFEGTPTEARFVALALERLQVTVRVVTHLPTP